MTLLLDAPELQRPRLAACVLLSILVHVALVASLPRPLPGPSAPRLLVLLLRPAPPEPAAPAASALPPQRAGFMPPRAHPPQRPPLGRRTTGAARAALPATASAPVVRVPLSSVYVAYNDLTPEQAAEKLSEAQRRVPRGNALRQPPQELQEIRPQYPPDELKRGRRATVLLEAFISAGGAVEDVVVLDDGGEPAFAAAATQAVRGAAFRAARDAQGPVASRATLAVRFTFE